MWYSLPKTFMWPIPHIILSPRWNCNSFWGWFRILTFWLFFTILGICEQLRFYASYAVRKIKKAFSLAKITNFEKSKSNTFWRDMWKRILIQKSNKMFNNLATFCLMQIVYQYFWPCSLCWCELIFTWWNDVLSQKTSFTKLLDIKGALIATCPS